MVSHLKANGIRLMRGGAFKPRTSPYAFRRLGWEGLKLLHAAASEAGIKVVSEVLSPTHIADMYPYVDVFLVGARNSQIREIFPLHATLQDPENVVQHLTLASPRSPSAIAPNFQLRQMSAKQRPWFVIKVIFAGHRYSMANKQNFRCTLLMRPLLGHTVL